jgi:hypothetical protein
MNVESLSASASTVRLTTGRSKQGRSWLLSRAPGWLATVALALLAGCGGGDQHQAVDGNASSLAGDPQDAATARFSVSVFPVLPNLELVAESAHGIALGQPAPIDADGRTSIAAEPTAVRLEASSREAGFRVPLRRSARWSGGSRELELNPLTTLFDQLVVAGLAETAARSRVYGLLSSACTAPSSSLPPASMYGDQPIVGPVREWLLPALGAYIDALGRLGLSPRTPGIDWPGLLDTHATVLTQLCDTARAVATDAWLASANAAISAQHSLSTDLVDRTIRSLRLQALELVLARVADGLAVRQYPSLATTLDVTTPSWIGNPQLQVVQVIGAAVARVGMSDDAVPTTLPPAGFDERGAIVEFAASEVIWTDVDPAPVRFANRAAETRQLRVTINGVSLNSLADLVFDTLALPAEHADEPLHRRAWRYVVRRRAHAWPVTGGLFQHQADLFLRSVGLGFCDDAAAVLARLWRALGHEVRVIGLSGHVVPEVHIDDRWELYDPDYGVYYLNQKQQVASVADLEQDVALIISPVQQLPNALPGAYHAALAALYSSTADNYVASWATDESPVPFGPVLDVPAGASLEVHGAGAIEVPTIELGAPISAAALRLKLPRGFTGMVRLPYVLTDATGDGSVAWRERSYDVASDEFVASMRSWYLDTQRVGITAIEIERVGPQGLTLTMMVNPSLAPNGRLSVALSGVTVDGIVAVASTQ